MRTRIRSLLATHGRLPLPIEHLTDEQNLFVAGLTSFASVQLMLALEEEFDIEIPDNKLNRHSFSTIDRIATVVEEIREAQSV